MARINRGGDFENQIEKGFKQVPNAYIRRVKNRQTGYVGDDNPCDYIAYLYPYMYMIECKTTYEHTLNWSYIRPNQWDGLLEASEVTGIIAGYMIWYIEDNKTIFVPAKELKKHKDNGYKSLNVNKDLDKVNHYVIKGKKRRVLFDYDMGEFLDEYSKL